MADPMPCLIVECSDAETWPSLFTGEPPRFGTDGPVRIPQARQPAILQPDRETAEREATKARRGGRTMSHNAAVTGRQRPTRG